MSAFKRIARSTLIFIAVGITTSCNVTEAAQTPTTSSSDQAHIDHDAFLKAHDAKLGDKSTPGSLIGLTSKLSDDIGIMADRIGTMADRILLMADNIVKVINSQTQASLDVIKLGADLALKIDTINAACNTSVSGATLTSPISGSFASINLPPMITYTNAVPTTKYQLLVSKSALFPNGSTVTKLVDTAVGASSLATAWTQAMSDLAITANTQLYVAIRSIDAKNNPSDLSNGVLLRIQ